MNGRHARPQETGRHRRAPGPSRHAQPVVHIDGHKACAALTVAGTAGVSLLAAPTTAAAAERAAAPAPPVVYVTLAELLAVVPYPLADGWYFAHPRSITTSRYTGRLVSGYRADPTDGLTLTQARDRVRQAQRWLAEDGLLDPDDDVDGLLGPRTTDAVRRFQARRGLVVDGILGPATWRELQSQPSTPPPPPSCSRATTYTGYDRLTEHTKTQARDIAARFCPRLIGGWRAGDSGEHPQGRALDVMTYTDMALGQRVADWAVATAAQRRVLYVIWNRRIWSAARAREGWRPYTGASPHTDHVHISYAA